jgi:hypothetical protein
MLAYEIVHQSIGQAPIKKEKPAITSRGKARATKLQKGVAFKVATG